MDEHNEFAIPQEVVETLRDPEVIKQYVEEGKTFQEIIGYEDATMEKFYAAAYRLFERGEFRQAADAFIFLTTLNPYTHKYWLGLGMAEQSTEEFEAALVAYAMAVMIQVSNPIPHFHSATCYYRMGDKNSAAQSLDLAIEQAGDQAEYAELCKAAEAFKQRLFQ